MANDKQLAVYIAVYDDVEAAKSGLEDIEQLHKEDLSRPGPERRGRPYQ
jgi:hypothetical protein